MLLVDDRNVDCWFKVNHIIPNKIEQTIVPVMDPAYMSWDKHENPLYKQRWFQT